MSNPSKEKGDRWEREVVIYIRETYPDGLKLTRTRAGQTNDRGDLAGDALAAYELRNRRTPSYPGSVGDARRHAEAADKPIGVAIIKKAGTSNPAEATVAMTLEDYLYLRNLAGEWVG